MLLFALLSMLSSTVLANPTPPCLPADKTKCGCPALASLTVSSHAANLNVSMWLSSENDTTVDKVSSQKFDTTIASDFGYRGYLLWPGGLVFYLIDSAFSASYQSLIRTAIEEAQAVIGRNYVEFVEAKTSFGTICRQNYIHIKPLDKAGCKANIGMQPVGVTLLELHEDYCKFAYAVIHELLHTMGREHEHSRKDRETHLQLNYANILSSACASFQKSPVFDLTGSMPYDYDSIMHYGSCGGSCNGDYVFNKKDGSPIGLNDKLTNLDVKKIRFMYPSEKKVPYIAKRLCRGPNSPIESVESLAEKIKKYNKSFIDLDEDDPHSTGHAISTSRTLTVVLPSMGVLAQLIFVLH